MGIEIFNKLLQNKASGDCETLSDVEIWRKALSACQGIVDVNFSSKGMNKNSEKEKVIMLQKTFHSSLPVMEKKYDRIEVIHLLYIC